jgi:murein DD-endopeptidase MepM/ murein hydrolase activator NlpD
MKTRMSIRMKPLLLFVIPYALGCGATDPEEPCGGYPDWESSPYVLPYGVGTAHEVVQGNCTPAEFDSWNSHGAYGPFGGPWAFAYDFLMPIGTEIVAVRGGTVVFVWDEYSDNYKEEGNSISIRHDDGTYAGYGHLTQHGALVEVGQQVTQGEIVALSGNSGPSDTPHLHFEVRPCEDLGTPACETLPVTFRNTRPNPTGLQRGEVYEALPY